MINQTGILACLHDEVPELWDMRQGRLLRRCEWMRWDDGERAHLTVSTDGDLQDAYTIPANPGWKPIGVNRLALSDDGSLLAAITSFGHLRVWNAKTGDIIADPQLIPPDPAVIIPEADEYADDDLPLTDWELSFDLKCTIMVAASRRNGLFVIDCATWQCIRYEPEGVSDIAFQAERGLLAIAYDNYDREQTDHRVELVAYDSWSRVGILSGHYEPVRTCAFSAKGDRMICVSNDGHLVMWDIDTQTDCWDKYAPEYYSLAFFAHDRFILSRHNSKVDILESHTGARIGSIGVFTTGDWLVVAPDGRYDCSPGCEARLLVTVGKQCEYLDLVEQRQRVPGLLRILVGEV